MEEHDRILKLLGFEVFRADDKFYYKTPKPGRRSLHKVSEVKSFLEREKAEGRLLNVTKEMFHFRRKRKQSESLGAGGDAGDAGQCPAASPLSDAECAGAVSTCWSPGQRDTDCPSNGLCCVSIYFLNLLVCL